MSNYYYAPITVFLPFSVMLNEQTIHRDSRQSKNMIIRVSDYKS